MKVLFVCSGNFEKSFAISQVFVSELISSLEEKGVEYNIFFIKGKGFWGYFSSLIKFWIKLIHVKYDLIHAFYGLSGLIACFQFKTPSIVSFLGSDINIKKQRNFSKLALKFSNYSIFVEKSLALKIKAKKSFSVIPFGINTTVFFPINKTESRKKLEFPEDEMFILFSSRFDNEIKNYKLAKNAIKLTGLNIRVVELGKSYTRKELNLLYNAADVFIMTSLHEGSPQTIKEAMACNCPIVSTDVGDVKWIVEEIDGCFISSFDPDDVANKLKLALEFAKKEGRTKGSERITELGLDSDTIAKKMIETYQQIIKNDCNN